MSTKSTNLKVSLNFDFFMMQFMETPSFKETDMAHMVVIDPEGDIVEYQRRKDAMPRLGELQSIVGGDIEKVWGNEDGTAIAFVDEDGRQKRLPRNEKATQAIRMEHDSIVGNTVFLFGFDGM